MNLEVNNIKELYELLIPALETKEIQLRRNDFLGISKKDIWDYLTNTSWKNSSDLRLHQMVSDILEADNEAISRYKEI
jgi:hypothetical protein